MISILELFGGVGLFLFGMSLMGSSLEKIAGSGLAKILQTLTTSKRKGVGALKGWGLGLGVTGIIQSSAATTIMLIGFVNAGIMTLGQAIPVVYGANVGSTVTAQILRLGDLGSGSLVLKLLKPSSFAPMLVAVGVFIHLFTKKQKLKDVAGILIGLGTLFYGMTMMEEVFAPLKESEKFQSFFLSFNNPFLGILTGLVLTAVIQSSSASVGILQALSATGSVTYGIAVPIIIGQNIGKCMTILLGSIGANKKAKRVAMSYLLFNIAGALIFSIIIYSIYYTVGIPFFSKVVNRGDIANIHLGFNLIISIILLPFSNGMASLTGKILKDSDEVYGDEELRRLDDMLLKTPGIALTQCKELMHVMGEKILENYEIATGLITEYDKNAFNRLADNENFIDKCETVMSDYIVRINRKRLTIDNQNMVTAILNSIGDYERIGDYCMNIAFTAQECNEGKVVFSDKGALEIAEMTEAVRHMIKMTFTAFDSENMNQAYKIQPLAKIIKEMKAILESHHVLRLQVGDCGVAGGVALYDLVNSFTRIASHSRSISGHVIKRLARDESLDAMHGRIVDRHSEEYKALETYYRTKYIEEMLKAEANIKDGADNSRKDLGQLEAASSSIKDKLEKKSEESKKSKKDKTEKDKKEKSEKEKAEKDKAAKEKYEKEKASKEKAAKEKREKEKADKKEEIKKEKEIKKIKKLKKKVLDEKKKKELKESSKKDTEKKETEKKDKSEKTGE